MGKKALFNISSKEHSDALRAEIDKKDKRIEELEEEIRGGKGSKSQFFSSISHDLRTPLSLILGNLDLIIDNEECYLTPSAKRSLEVSFKNAKRILYLAEEMNDIVTLEEGRFKIKRAPVQIGPFLKVLVDMFRPSVELKGIAFDFVSTLKSGDTVLLDTRQFEKVFYHLVSNALRHTPSGQSMTITATKERNNLLLEFKDTGAGMSPETTRTISAGLHKIKGKEEEKLAHLGLGLAMVRELIELHEGEVSVNSRLGKGTSFLISLPLEAEQEGQTAELSDFIHAQREFTEGFEKHASASVNLTNSPKKPRILIVDDHPEIRYYIRQILEDEYDIREAAHGLEALDILGSQQIDLIITDLMMPWMDGFELIEAIQSNSDLNKIPILIVSARISDGDREKALIQGINDFVQKPFDKKELTLRISNLIHKTGVPTEFDAIASRQNLEVHGVEILKKVESFIKENIEDTNLSVLQLGDAIAASERQVYRLIKKVTGKTPYEYITDVRLQYADYLIRQNRVRSSSEAARNVGIKNVTTFNKQFEKRFGFKPKELFPEG